jgi:hypothetical protein
MTPISSVRNALLYLVETLRSLGRRISANGFSVTNLCSKAQPQTVFAAFNQTPRSLIVSTLLSIVVSARLWVRWSDVIARRSLLRFSGLTRAAAQFQVYHSGGDPRPGLRFWCGPPRHAAEPNPRKVRLMVIAIRKIPTS